MTRPATAAQPRLTIGIPTYNFGATIGETLASIAAAICDGVDIVIVDAGSTDETPDVVAAWSDRLPITYHRKSSRDGIDVDIALTMSLARAEYCWLLSADDTVEPDAIASILSHIADRPDVILLTHRNCDVAMRVMRAKHPVLRGPTRRIAIATATDRERYFADALTTEALFSFLSGLVVRSAAWDADRDVADLSFGSCWSHAIRLLLRMRDYGLTIRYDESPLVLRRGDNDSFAGRGTVARYALGIEGYAGIVADIFGRDSPEYQHILRLLRAEFTPIMFMYAKRAAEKHPDRENLPHLTKMFRTLYPAQARFIVARAVYTLPAAPFIRMFEAMNAVRHRMLGRAA